MTTTIQATGNTRPWIEALALFDRLAELPPEACEKELATLPGENPELFRHVMMLLRAHWESKGGAFLTLHAPPTGERAAMTAASLTLAPGAALGPYRLESPLGRGGMGEVWLSRRSDGLFEAPVALKLLHPHLQTSTLRERFVREGRILGQLSHPNIARLLDAGSLPDQRLYLAIEYVEGERIDHACDRAHHTIRERVRLFLQVCDAVSHAHARLAVHRDLKPSNILVTPRGDIKLLDFGIAKLLESDQSASESTELTRLGGRALTPEYAAPEQILGKTITVATDVYSLGMVLYGLLTGRRAYGHGTESLVDLERAVVETDPPPPSQYPRAPGATLADDAASLRGMSGAELRDALRGDLDTIVLKALKKNPAERYGSVAAFADDLRCYLEDRPVSAQPDSLAYRAKKYVRRHRLGVAAATAVALAVIAGVSGVVFQAREAQRARAAAEAAEHRATQRSEEADDLIGFMLGDLRDKLADVGRLELLDDVGDKALDYFESLPVEDRTDDELFRRSETLRQIGEVR
ncbi:MAG TPA: serine/threonine-protein kinase, partial [Nevskiaceae bacterium]|nr:serine/threonine-protein kinase [Nevskiaceae bacterium]